jgi:hypothetical protein
MSTDHRPSAAAYLAQVCADYAQTMPPSVRGPFQSECQKALDILAQPAAPAADAPADGKPAP